MNFIESCVWCKLLLALVRYYWWSLHKHVLSAALEDAVIYQVELHARSLSIHNEKNVVCFQYLVVPA